MGDWWKRISQQPWLARLLRAVERYGSRMGDPFGAAITYFSVLSIVPIVMFVFAIVGMVLTVLRPDLLLVVQNAATGAISDETLKTQISAVIENAAQSWRTIGLVGLLTAAYAGAGWVAGLKTAIRAQFRSSFDLVEKKKMFVLEVLTNLAILVGLLAAVVVTFAISTASTSLATWLLSTIGLGESLSASILLRLASFAASLVAGWLLYMFIFRVMPEVPPQGRALRQGALVGSVGLAALQYLTGILIGAFAKNATAALFGPVIVLMLFFNLFARLTLYVAAWIATWQPEQAPVERAAGSEAPGQSQALPLVDTAPEPVRTGPDPAAQSVPRGAGAGYLSGVAAGLALGALLAGWAERRLRGRSNQVLTGHQGLTADLSGMTTGAVPKAPGRRGNRRKHR